MPFGINPAPADLKQALVPVSGFRFRMAAEVRQTGRREERSDEPIPPRVCDPGLNLTTKLSPIKHKRQFVKVMVLTETLVWHSFYVDNVAANYCCSIKKTKTTFGVC